MEKQKLKEEEAEAAAAEATAAPVDNEKMEAEKAKREKENSKKHADFLAKELKALDQVHSLEWGVAAVYLGSDRAHRRYWLFQSLNGIFIENDIENVNSNTKDLCTLLLLYFSYRLDPVLSKQLHLQLYPCVKTLLNMLGIFLTSRITRERMRLVVAQVTKKMSARLIPQEKTRNQGSLKMERRYVFRSQFWTIT
jgi:hypothetical protein